MAFLLDPFQEKCWQLVLTTQAKERCPVSTSAQSLSGYGYGFLLQVELEGRGKESDEPSGDTVIILEAKRLGWRCINYYLVTMVPYFMQL